MDGAPTQVVLVVVLSIIAALFVSLRLWAKYRRRTIGLDDLLIVVGLLLTWLLGIEDILWASRGHEGESMESLNQQQVEQFFKYFFANQVTYTMVPLPIKLSILLSYHKIFGTYGYYRLASYVVGGITVAWSFIMLFLCIFQCHPVSAFWENPTPEHCGDLTNYAYGNAISNLQIDVIILVMPAFPLWKLQISSVQRRLAFISFALGFFVCIASIVRITTIRMVGVSQNLSMTIEAPGTWTFIEPSVGIISACLPFLRPLFSRSRNGISSAYGQSADPPRGPAGIAHASYGGDDLTLEKYGKRKHSSITAFQHGISPTHSSHSHHEHSSTPSQVSIEMGVFGRKRAETESVIDPHILRVYTVPR